MTLFYYGIAATLEIIGCYQFAQKNYLIAVPALLAFAYILTLLPYEPQKSYVIYGGIYILANIAWLYTTGIPLTHKEITGIVLLLTGVILLL